MTLEFLVFPVVGAVIGAVTNEIAIKMLFRPYRPVHVLGQRLPFTPGVIPSQRGTIAQNIAETFEQRLLSGQELHAVLTGPDARRAVEGKVSQLIQELGPLGMMAKGFQPRIVDKVIAGIEELAEEAMSPGGRFDVGKRIEDKINEMDIRDLEALVLGFSRKQFRHITFFGGVLGALIGLVQAILSTWV